MSKHFLYLELLTGFVLVVKIIKGLLYAMSFLDKGAFVNNGNLTKLNRNGLWVVLYQNCSNGSDWLHKYRTSILAFLNLHKYKTGYRT